MEIQAHDINCPCGPKYGWRNGLLVRVIGDTVEVLRAGEWVPMVVWEIEA